MTLPILTVKLWTSAPSVDLVLCRRFSDGRPVDERSKIALHGIRNTSILWDALRNACSRNDNHIQDVFSGALRIIKLWAFRRGLYGSSTGFLGGGAWAVLLAHTMIYGTQESALMCPSSGGATSHVSLRVVKHFFETSSRWSLPLSVNLTNELVGVRATRPMTIASSSEVGSLGRSTTLSTALAVMNELRRAASLLGSTEGDLTTQLAAVLHKPSLADFYSVFETILLIRVSAPEDKSSGICVSDVKAWACRQLLHLTLGIERVLNDASLVRPRPTPIREYSKSSKTFVWLIGVKSPISRELLDFVDTNLSSMQQDWASTFSLASLVDNMPMVEIQNTYEFMES